MQYKKDKWNNIIGSKKNSSKTRGRRQMRVAGNVSKKTFLGDTEAKRVYRHLGHHTAQDAGGIASDHNQRQALVQPVELSGVISVINKYLGKGTKYYGKAKGAVFQATSTLA